MLSKSFAGVPTAISASLARIGQLAAKLKTRKHAPLLLVANSPLQLFEADTKVLASDSIVKQLPLAPHGLCTFIP